MPESQPEILEATIDDIQQAYNSGQLTSRRLVQFYLDRITAYDKQGPALNSIITINGAALDEAEFFSARGLYQDAVMILRVLCFSSGLIDIQTPSPDGSFS